MNLLTPAEYGDAYLYLQQQDTAAHAMEVSALIEPHVVRIQAERIRIEAAARYGDSRETIFRRRAVLAQAYRRGSR